ncbi:MULTISPECIES: NUDIX hydrolase [Pseudomonas]|uniref:NUDIX hydrolase n=1 Tax=Pseudomonas TaxID=286 RepID=UPI000410431E|nr:MULTISPECIES: NUDIX domain-containing protein [Pseudomonas]MBK4989414.1 NUDIX domain-containing protein [Pseudomonas sp. S36]
MKSTKARATIICRHGKHGHKWLWVRKHKAPWTLPGGKVEPGETPAQAAERELLEETGLQAMNLTLLMRHESTERMHYVFEAEFDDAPKPCAMHEIADFRFAHIDHVAALKGEIKDLIRSLLACDASTAASVR